MKIHKAFITHEWLSKSFNTSDLMELYKQISAANWPRDLYTQLHSTAMYASTSSYIVREVASTGAKEVLEFGSKKGAVTLQLAQLFPSVRFHGAEHLQANVDAANKAKDFWGLSNSRFFCTTAADFAKHVCNKVDLIFAVESVHHLDTHKNMAAFFRQAASCIAPSGRLVVVDYYQSSTYDAATPNQRLAMQLAESAAMKKHTSTRLEWVNVAANYGFVTRSHTDLTNLALPYWTSLWRVSRVVLSIPLLRSLLIRSSPRLARLLLASCTMTHALRDKGAAEFGVMVFVKQ